MADFGRAVGLNPEKARNYYLRADCHGKLGNYELAIQDYDNADTKGFDDMVSLCMARGTLYRLTGHYRPATKDFDRALNHHKTVRGDGMLAIRIQLLRSLCLIDVKRYAKSCDILHQAFDMLKTRNMSFSPIKEVLDSDDESQDSQESEENLPLFSSSLSFELDTGPLLSIPVASTTPGAGGLNTLGIGSLTKLTGGGAMSVDKNNHLNKLSVQNDLLNSKTISASSRKMNTYPDDDMGQFFSETTDWTNEITLKLEWTVQYHISLSLYMQKKYSEAAEVSDRVRVR